jgi:hypothetical protein
MKRDEKKKMVDELRNLVNRLSVENESDTPDFVLAEYILGCLTAYKKAVRARDHWFDFKPWAGIEMVKLKKDKERDE